MCDVAERFDRFVRKDVDGCWYWTGAKGPKGYGFFWYRGNARPAHRVAFILAYPALDYFNLPSFLYRTCNRPDCVNPDHFSF